MRESELERKFCRLVGQSGGKAYKFTSPGNSGVPDRLVVLPEGRIGFVELKQGGGNSREDYSSFKWQSWKDSDVTPP